MTDVSVTYFLIYWYINVFFKNIIGNQSNFLCHTIFSKRTLILFSKVTRFWQRYEYLIFIQIGDGIPTRRRLSYEAGCWFPFVGWCSPNLTVALSFFLQTRSKLSSMIKAITRARSVGYRFVTPYLMKIAQLFYRRLGLHNVLYFCNWEDFQGRENSRWNQVQLKLLTINHNRVWPALYRLTLVR